MKNVLVLKHFRLSDFFEERQKIEIDEEPIFFNEREKTYTLGQELRVYPDLKCWNCDTKTEYESTFVPLYPKNGPNGLTYERFGHYCSWPCAARDAFYRFGNMKDYSDIIENMRTVFNYIHSSGVPHVFLAPDKSQINEYSGNQGLSRNEYIAEVKRMTANMKKM